VAGHFSDVSISITEKGGESFLALKHSGIPSADAERARHGWLELHFARMKMVLGLGTGLAMGF
jgi:activator of HSP90 ATPase